MGGRSDFLPPVTAEAVANGVRCCDGTGCFRPSCW